MNSWTRIALAVSMLTFADASLAQFTGHLNLAPDGCEASGHCTLVEALRYTDPNRLVWEAAKGLATDGASIPTFFQPLIGKPFEEQFLKAAIIHDHYCVRHVRSWSATHRVFYDGLLDQGVPKYKAKLMYYAVYLAGPKWADLVPGKNCGRNCINNVTTKGGTPVLQYRKADYGNFDMDKELRDVAALMTIEGEDAITLSRLEMLAKTKRPGDDYYTYGDRIPVSGEIYSRE